MALTAERLRNNERFSGENVTQFLLFLPLGLCLFVVRTILALILWVASIILPNKSTVRQMLSTLACWTFGVYVKVKGQRDARCSMLVANYASCLDSLAAAHALGTISLRKWKVPPFFASTLGIRNAAQFVRKEHFGDCTSAPLLVQPEGGPANGRGLLRFADWPFPVAQRVQPVAIEVERVFTAVTVHTGHDGFPWRDALWFLLAPVTVYKLTLLPTCEVTEAATVIAEHLQIEATDIEYSALCRSAAPRSPAATGPSRELLRRAQQVKEVLPRVPLRDIMRDLAITRSVDVTVTNFLEGVTPYTPEPAPAQGSGAAPPQAGPSAPRYVTPPVQAPFPKNAKERQLSFQERKAQMIAEARQRYIEKHGLNLSMVG
ncbi:lipid droplet-regulating VLDL assembly factor AUP1-like [Leguminivora glycinivorella]|uniref:lipid droplet-regulating VLDL assembly factor AUP1-like n=1 Tax=Leguminivora glycinivorella TaxID=1035111 RepID=UPI00200E4C0B|nr:lipid droplet-regulating VLDL assembly factor AUP1-like [Leguminivora glycinivorella]